MAAQAPAGNPSMLATHDPQLALRAKQLSQMLSKRGAKNGARRLEEVSQQFQHFTVEGASHYIRKDEIIDELESQPHKVLSILRFARNVLSIAPIVLTWFALGSAAIAYQSDLADTRHYPNDLYQPFLRLWQGGFHGRTWLPFSTAAYTDFWLLAVLVILIAGIPILEWWRRERLYTTHLKDFDSVIDELLGLIGRDGANSHLAESDVNKISRAIEAQLQKVMLSYKQVAVETREIVKNTNEETQKLIQSFNTDLGVFNSDVTLLAGGLQKLDNDLSNYGQKLIELTDASSKLAGSSNDLALNAKSMADSANLSSQASQGISSQLGALSAAQQEIIKTQQDVATTISQTQGDVVKQFATTQQNVVQEIERAQKEVVKEISSVADDMDESTKNTRDVATELENVVKGLKQMTQTDFQIMTNEVTNAANQVDRVATSLGQVDTQLQLTTKALADVAKTMKLATKSWWQFWK